MGYGQLAFNLSVMHFCGLVKLARLLYYLVFSFGLNKAVLSTI